MDPFDLSQRESQAGHSSTGQPVQDGDGSAGVHLRPCPQPSLSPWDNGAAGELLALEGFPCMPLSSLPGLGLGPVLKPNLTLVTRIQLLRQQDRIGSQGLNTCLNWYRARL